MSQALSPKSVQENHKLQSQKQHTYFKMKAIEYRKLVTRLA